MSDLSEPMTLADRGPAAQHHFAELAEAYRAELRLYCYRMLGSLPDAEDLVQETLTRAWRRRSTYEGRGPVRSWLYRIATNACLDSLGKRARRRLPLDTRGPSDPRHPPEPPILDPIWLDPFPDDRTDAVADCPEARYTLRESIRLAFLAALQALPPRQRAVLILRDVLDWRAAEVAELLGATISSVNSALHRARSTMRRLYHPRGRGGAQSRDPDRATLELLERYIEAWEAADVAELVALLKEDATFTMPPSPSWYRGRSAIGAFLGLRVLTDQDKMRWRLRPARANGEPATGVYRRDPASGRYQPYAIQVLAIEGRRIAEVTNFKSPGLFRHFDLPELLGGE
jgi:RNA polymerase sigma-70 factor (ECF subfamily)